MSPEQATPDAAAVGPPTAEEIAEARRLLDELLDGEARAGQMGAELIELEDKIKQTQADRIHLDRVNLDKADQLGEIFTDFKARVRRAGKKFEEWCEENYPGKSVDSIQNYMRVHKNRDRQNRYRGTTKNPSIRGFIRFLKEEKRRLTEEKAEEAGGGGGRRPRPGGNGQPSAPDPEDLLLEGADDAADVGRETVPFQPPAGRTTTNGKAKGPTPHTASTARTVDLFFDAVQYDEFKGLVEMLKPLVGTKNPSETVLVALRWLAGHLEDKAEEQEVTEQEAQ
jgi:hypothetical protein